MKQQDLLKQWGFDNCSRYCDPNLTIDQAYEEAERINANFDFTAKILERLFPGSGKNINEAFRAKNIQKLIEQSE